MADESMDPCECIWNHELAMRRLLSLLRQGQTYCTDSECLEELPRMGNQTENGDNFVLMSVIMLFAMVLYMLRPRRSQQSLDEKPVDQQGPSGLPPPPPPPAAPTN